MSPHRLAAAPPVPRGLHEGFARIRAEAELPSGFPADVLEAAERAAAAGPCPADRRDLRDVPFVTVDPPGSTDLDQALHIARDGDGFLLRYAIADVGAFVTRGDPVDEEAWRRGATMYLPDGRVPLYPPVLSESAASLLPDGDRVAIVFAVRVAADGTPAGADVGRAVIRSRAKLAYPDVGDDGVPLLRELGTVLAGAARRRGATGIDLPDQEVEPADTPEGFVLALRERLPSEDWNAEVSLCANVAAAEMMWAAGGGLFRVMGAPDPERAAGLRAAAVALGFAVPPQGPRELADITGPPEALTAFRRTARSAGGAGYRAMSRDGGGEPWHAAVGARYAHATAPLRRLADRHVLEALVAARAGEAVTADDIATFERLATVMNRADTRADRVEAAAIDLVEATLMHGLVGRTFEAVVTGTTDSSARVQLREPAVRGVVPGGADLPPGTTVTVRLMEADPGRRSVRLALAGPANG